MEDYDCREVNAAVHPMLSTYNRMMGRGKKHYADWLTRNLGIPFEAGDPRKVSLFDGTALTFWVKAENRMERGNPHIDLEVHPTSRDPNKLVVDVNYKWKGKTTDWKKLEVSSVDEFRDPRNIFDANTLKKFKDRISGSYDYSDEIEQFKKSVEEKAAKIIENGEKAKEALFLTRQMNSLEDMDTILDIIKDITDVSLRGIFEYANVIKNRQLTAGPPFRRILILPRCER